jgi:hypothetical protein
MRFMGFLLDSPAIIPIGAGMLNHGAGFLPFFRARRRSLDRAFPGGV